ncbi:hypothetical protein AK812_SmicGene25753 [Symbiodinium microadriaticum]|uniref:Uncharacterized protein n=1 Tax=Symbiodinium microadriaticum TaxID=2951 RepID=A0A1Q9DBG4_SYMMI|nr:hypothetical protein AK812_SmicGene25753 [Symbiodinium microadriaticum]
MLARRDRYEPDVKLYWLEKSVEGKMLKRKREIYEEEDSDAEMQESDDEADLDVFGMNWGLGEGDDQKVAEADRGADVKKNLKSISFPEMDADGLPSSYIVKVVNCLGKWIAKLQAVTDQLDDLKKTPKSEKQLDVLAEFTYEASLLSMIMEKAKLVISGLEKTTETIQSKQADSVLQDQGFTLAQQDEIKRLFDAAKKQVYMAKRVRSLASVLWDDDEDVDALLLEWKKPDNPLTVRSKAKLVVDNSDDVPERPEIHPVLKLDLVVEKPGLLKLRRTRDPWYWLQQVSQEVKGLPRLQQEVIHDLERTQFANGAIVFDLPTSSLASSILSHAELCIRCTEALSFCSGCAPMLQYMKSQKKKDDTSKKAPASSVTAHQRAMVLQKGVEATREELGEPVLQTGQRCNGKYHSYLTRFLLAAFPSKQWPQELLSDLIRALSSQLRELFNTGLLVNGRRYYFGILGLKGDFEFHCTCLRDAGLKRSYEHVGRAQDIPVCIECEAGFPDTPMEDANVGAAWTRTIGKSAPWERLPSFGQVPFDNWCSFPSRAPEFFRRDPFHVFRLGVARNFLASAILLLCNLGAFDLQGESRSVENRLVRAWRHFQLFMETASLHVGGLRSFSKKKMHFASGGAFPWLGCKGSDTIVLLKWLQVLLVQLRSRGCAVVTGHDFASCRACIFIERAVTGGLQFSQGIHGHSLWLVPSCTSFLRQSLYDFLRGYSQLAQYCLVRKMPLFGITPKFHAMCHYKHELEMSLRLNQQATINPAAFDCSMSEDKLLSVQGLYTAVEVTHNMAGTVLVPGSHRTKLPREDKSLRVDENFAKSYLQSFKTRALMCKLVRPYVPAGGLLLFNSKLIHANDPGTVRRSEADGLPNRLALAVAYSPRKRRSEATRKRKIQAYFNGSTSNHWPCDRFSLKTFRRNNAVRGSRKLPEPPKDAKRLRLL